MDCHVFLNHQAGQVKKDLVRAHGAELYLVEGKIGDAGAAFEERRREEGWYSVATFQTPFRHEGKKTMGYEVFEDLGWATPDEIVYPTGGGVGLIGIWKAYQELADLGWVKEDPPALTVAQTEGAAPVVDAIERGADCHDPWSDPETAAKGVEIPDPGASPWILEAVSETGGAGVAVSDDDATAAALEIARKDGVEMCVTAAVALAGAMRRAEQGAYDGDETLVVINTGAGVKTSDQLGVAVQED
jgi:threonine synthase